jgi:hypothetical protein
MHRQPPLLEVVAARHTCGGLADLLHGGLEQRDEDAEDGDDDEQLDERERAASWRARGGDHDVASGNIDKNNSIVTVAERIHASRGDVVT